LVDANGQNVSQPPGSSRFPCASRTSQNLTVRSSPDVTSCVVLSDSPLHSPSQKTGQYFRRRQPATIIGTIQPACRIDTASVASTVARFSCNCGVMFSLSLLVARRCRSRRVLTVQLDRCRTRKGDESSMSDSSSSSLCLRPFYPGIISVLAFTFVTLGSISTCLTVMCYRFVVTLDPSS
jgi:hypothetical protein